jgi:ABC-type hemin transport system substrate-binding protein
MNTTAALDRRRALPPVVVLACVAIEQPRFAGIPIAITDRDFAIESAGRRIRFVAAALGVPEKAERRARRLEGEISPVRAQVVDLAAKAGVANFVPLTREALTTAEHEVILTAGLGDDGRRRRVAQPDGRLRHPGRRRRRSVSSGACRGRQVKPT